MIVDPSELSSRARYQLLISTLVPRPIAWVSTVSLEGLHNLAPFSFFAGVSAAPITMMISVGRRQGQRKDTANNLLETPECVVHIPNRALIEAMVATSEEAEASVDEFELVALDYVSADDVKARRLKDAPVAFECRMVKHVELGPNDLFFLQALKVHLDDAILAADGLPNAAELMAVGRMGRNQYAVADHLLELERPAGRKR